MDRKSRVVVLVVAALSPLAVISAQAQCSDGTTELDYWDSVTRTSGNNILAESATQVVGDGWGYWEVYINGATVTVGSTTVNSGSNNSGSYGGNDSGGTLADAATDLVWNDSLSTYGAGTYTISAQHQWKSSCGDNETLMDSDSLTITQPTITTPGGYPPGDFAFWYLGGYPAIDGYSITANFTGNANLGTCVGCSPTYNWEVIDRPGALSITGANTTSPTLTSEQASGGAVYDVSVVFTVDGFSSAKTWINLNTPVAIYVDGTPGLVSNPEGCANPNVNGGYDYQVIYYISDLWSYAINPLTTNEKNDAYSNDTGGAIVGWYMSASWEDDDTWSAADWNPNGWSFTDHLEASDCAPGWTPPPVQPHSLNSLVQQTPQYWHTANATSNVGIVIGSDTQYWYTDHGNRN